MAIDFGQDPIIEALRRTSTTGSSKKKDIDPITEMLQRGSVGVPTESVESYRELMKSLTSAERARLGLSSFGLEPPKEREGIMSRLFNQRTGLISMPFRAVTGFVGAALDGGFDPEGKTRGLDPLTAAVRSAKGDFAITGGDIIKVNSDDNFLERLGKYAGALSIDIVADPTNWFGGLGTFSRKGASVLAVRQGRNMLDDATSLLASKGDDTGKLVDDMFERSRIVKAAKSQASGKLNVEETKLLDEITKLVPEAKAKAMTGTPLDLIQLTKDGVVDPSYKLKIAGFEFGNAIGEALYKGGRTEVRKLATSFLKDEKLVDDFMRSLPPEIAGGFYFKTPTGKPIAKLAGGLGKGSLGSKALNDLRFAITAARPVRFIPANFSGKAGVTFSAVKKGLIGGNFALDVDRTKLLDYVTFKKAIQERNGDLARMGIKASAKVSSALAVGKGFGDASKEEFDAALKNYFFSPDLPVAVDSPVQAAAAGAANDLRTAIMEAHAEARALGIEIGDLGPNWSPLRFTDEEYKRIAEFGYLKGGVDSENIYRPSEHRSKWIEIHPDPEVRKAMGFEDPNRPGLVYLNALSANKKLGRVAYVEDPVKIAQDYLSWINSSIASKKFVDTASSTGAILLFPRETRKILNSLQAETFMNAASKVSPKATQKALAIRDARRKMLDEALSEDRLKKVQADISGRRNETLGDYAIARDEEITARSRLREADAAVAEAEPTLLAAVERLRDYGQSGTEQELMATERLLKNAMSRRSRAEASREAAIADASNATAKVERYGPSQGRLDERAKANERASSYAAKAQEENEMVLSLREEVQAAESMAKQISEKLGNEQLQEFQNYQRALRAQQEAADAMQAAREKRITAGKEYRLAKEDTTLLRVRAVDEVVNAYVDNSIEFRNLRQRIGNTSIKDLPENLRKEYNEAKSNYEKAKQEMYDMLGYSTRKGAPGSGKAYADEIVRLAEALTRDEIVAARVIANSDRLETLVLGMSSAPRDQALKSIGDIYTIYHRLRSILTPDDFANLSAVERSVLSNKKLKDLLEVKSEVPVAARAMTKKAEEAGVKSTEGIRRIGAGVRNVDVKLPSAFRDSYAPEGIRSVLESMYKIQTDPNAWEKFISKIYDPLSLVWKTAVTVGRGPAYSVTNLVGGLVNNYLGGVRMKYHNMAAVILNTAVQTIRDLQADPKNINKSYFELVELAEGKLKSKLGNLKIKDRPAVELFVEFLERGGHFSSDIFFQADELSKAGISIATPLERRSGVQYQFTDEPTNKADSAFRKIVNIALNNPMQRKLNDLAASSEIFVRFAAVGEGYARYGDMDSAMDLMYMLHFDYQDLSDAEISIKRVVPFYTWMRNNIPLQLRLAFLQSGKVGNLINANEEMKAAFGVDGPASWLNDYIPDYMEINNGFVSYLKFGDNHMALFPKLPINDVDQMFGVGFIGPIPVPIPRRNQLLNIAGPVVRTPMEFFTNRNFQYGYEYESFGELASKQLEGTIPYIGTIARAASAAGLPVEKTPFLDLSREKGRQVSNFMQLMFGAPYGATMITERTIKSAARSQGMDSYELLDRAAAASGVDVEWLRKQINSGVSSAELTNKILSGEGNAALIKLQKIASGEIEDKRRDYFGTIRSLYSR
jgi:hypothetical protein